MSNQACLRCRTQKRKCDRTLPLCTLCKRLNKRCSYALPVEAPRLLPLPDGPDLNILNLRHTLEVQVSSVVGDHIQLQDAAALYFRTVHTWFPIVSEVAYRTQLSSLRVQIASASSDFSLLILCMALLCKEPVGGELHPSILSLYASLKSFVALLEAMGINTLEMVQSRALLTVFEIGHAMYPAACISAAANACAAAALGINATEERLHKLFQDQQRAEEARQTWRGVVITERFASLESGQPPSIPRGKSIDPVSFNQAEENSFGQLANASQLLEQVLLHIHTAPSHPLSDSAEAVEILKSLTSFLQTLPNNDSVPRPMVDSALALCRSAMLEILEVGSHMDIPENEFCISTSLNILKSLVHEILRGQHSCSPIEMSTMSVFLPRCLYKTAMVCLSDSRVSASDSEPLVGSYKTQLERLGTRWMAAGHYLMKIQMAEKTWAS